MSGEGFYLRKELKDEKLKAERFERMEQIEQRVYEHAAGIVEALMSFHEVDPHQTEPPEAWIEQYGEKAARQRLAIAKTGWLPASVAPHVYKLTVNLMTGISRGRNYKQMKLTQNNINVKIGLPAPTSKEHPGPTVYEVRDLEE
jgi:hypothetical protein